MERIGRYEILGEIGRGAMGIVYRAQDPVIGRTVAIKTIRLQDFSDPQELQKLRERLFREARSAGILSHPNIVTIYDIGQEGSTAYIAMEFVNGSTVEHILATEGVFPRERFPDLMRQTANALDYAHSKGIVHRDVKPANIMVTDTWAAKITDFGVAKIASQQMTRTDVLLGTPTYMSPEQIEGKPLDGRSDQFTLGAIAYELITGEKPFAAETVASLLFKIVQEEPVHVNRLNPTVTEGVSATIERAMSKSAADRFQTCEDFALALNEALRRAQNWKPQPRGAAASLPTVSTDHPAPSVLTAPPPAKFSRRPLPDESSASLPKAAPPKRGGRWVAFVAVIALGAAAGVLGVTYWTRDQAPDPAEAPRTVQREPEQPQVKPPPALSSPTADKPSPMAPPREQIEARTPPRQTAARTTPETQTPAEVQPVTITSTPPGATVTVDQSNETCRTPCALALPRGRRILRFNLAGYRPGMAILNVPEENTASARLDAVTGTVVVKTTPPGAEIYINGKLYDRRSNCIINLPAGRYGFEFRLPNEKGISQDIEVKDSVTQTVEVSWQ